MWAGQISEHLAAKNANRKTHASSSSCFSSCPSCLRGEVEAAIRLRALRAHPQLLFLALESENQKLATVRSDKRRQGSRLGRSACVIDFAALNVGWASASNLMHS